MCVHLIYICMNPARGLQCIAEDDEASHTVYKFIINACGDSF